GFRSADGASVPLASPCDCKRRPAETGRADITQTDRGVAPAAVAILVSREPVESAGNEVCALGRRRQCRNSHRRRKRARGKASFPISGRRAAIEKARNEILNGFVESGKIDRHRVWLKD